MREEARLAAERLEALVKEREAERGQLRETQTALREALQHLESVSNEAQVLPPRCLQNIYQSEPTRCSACMARLMHHHWGILGDVLRYRL
jgi:hypothetical protein